MTVFGQPEEERKEEGSQLNLRALAYNSLLKMWRPRVIPCLLLKNQGLVKTIKFKKPRYVGDPLNVVKIFNDKSVDELIILDIFASREKREPNFKLLAQIASECFMPLCYGGGIHNLAEIKKILSLGIEKVSLNASAVANPNLIRKAADYFGSQSIIVSLDVKKNFWGQDEIFIAGGRKGTKLNPVIFAQQVEAWGAGEILLNSIERDGTRQGYDLELIKKVSQAVKIPVIASGGAGSLEDLKAVIRQAGASAAAAGSLFIFIGPYRSVLINFPSSQELKSIYDDT